MPFTNSIDHVLEFTRSNRATMPRRSVGRLEASIMIYVVQSTIDTENQRESNDAEV